MHRILLLLALLVALPSTHAAPSDDDKTVLCFVGHKTSHGFMKHEYMAGCHLIAEWLDATYPDANIEARYAVPWPEDEDTFFKDADSVIFFCSGGGGHVVNKHVPEFDKVMRTGAGLACLHYGVEVPIGPSAKGMLAWMGGYFETNWSVNPHWVAEFKTFGDHPAARGVKPFKIDDEWYFHMRFVEGMKGVDPILSAVAPAKTMSRKDGAHSGNPAVRKAVAAGEPQHVGWTYQRGENHNNGRGFGFTGLHYHWNWEDDSFRKAVLNGVAWSSKLEIPENGIDTETPTREFLEANALKHGGEQGSKKKPAAAAKPAAAKPNATPLYESPVLRHSNPVSHSVSIDVAIPDGSKELALVISDAGDGYSHDWAAWAEPRLVMADGSEKKLTDLKWKNSSNGFGNLNINANCRGGDILVKGKKVENGIGAHANSTIVYDLPKGVKRFKARGVLDDGGTVRNGEDKTPTSVSFLVFNQAASVAGGAQSAADAYVKKSSAPGRDASEAIDSLEVHPDLEVQLFASEPMITSPSSIDIDAKGRVWVCDVVNYRRNQGKRPDGVGDQILILEDTDGDAKADKKTVFYQGHDVDSAHGICVLGDRVIISCGDEVFSLFDRDGDGKADPDSKKLMFTNIGGAQHDHGIHAFHFGPDSRLYFNFGNAGKRLCDPEGNLITDINGIKCTNENNRPYQEGMVFRCDLDGKNVELLAWNFRNNWEVAVDSFGTVWQSDNDDDGNKAVRINYVMEYGNFGYKDEITGAGWREQRIGMSDEIPERHWHQNDPGVVPNLLITGAGSPTGLVVYEGDLLPKIFHGQLIHCDAGPNVVRSYITEPDGAGYKVAETVDLISSTKDRWFRPSDVCVAPDGSLFVADWYDPGVGGHGMGDVEKGRIFRVIGKGHTMTKRYGPIVNVGLGHEHNMLLTTLRSATESTRFDAWQALAKLGKEAEWVLSENGAFNEKNDLRLRARALWLLAKTNPKKVWSILYDPKDDNFLSKADSDLRVTALRALRQHADAIDDEILWDLADPDPAFHRELAIATRYQSSDHSDQIWAGCMRSADEITDRWFLEALGIGADLRWNERLAAFHQHQIDDLTYEPVAWRSRSSRTADQLTASVLNQLTADGLELKPVGKGLSKKQALRAFAFVPNRAAVSADLATLFQKADPESALYAAGKLGPDAIAKIDGGPARLEVLLAPIRGTAEFVKLAERLGLRGFDDELANYIAKSPTTNEAVGAARLLLKNRNNLLNYLRDSEQVTRASTIITALGRTGDRSLGDLLAPLLSDAKTSVALKPAVINAMAGNGRAGQQLLDLATAADSKLDDSLKAAAALAFARSPDKNLREAGARRLPIPKAAGAENFPPLTELLALKGDAKKGAPLFVTATCNTCHKVKGEGIDFGPDLSEIGNKLGRDAMLEAILYPSAAVSHGFHGVSVTTKDGTALIGYATGETDNELQLRLPGGVDQAIAKKGIQKQEPLEQSLMPPGLAAVIGPQGLADLVSYLQTLKK